MDWFSQGAFERQRESSEVLLGTQAVPLPVLQTEVEQWQLWVLVERVAGGIDFQVYIASYHLPII